MAPDTDKGWIAAWDQLSSQQDRLSRELLLTWILVALVVGAVLLFAGGRISGKIAL
jgi:type VI protein secretion system component VasF